MPNTKPEIEIVEASLENTLEEMKNRRIYLKKVMKSAEDAVKDLAKATATNEVRLQGTKETKAPNLKPYTEALEVKDRHELGKLIRGAKDAGRPWTVRKSVKEGYRYTFFTTEIPQIFTETLHRSKLVLGESKENKEKEEQSLDNVPSDVVELDISPIEGKDKSASDKKELENSTGISDDEVRKAIQILKDKLSFHPGEKNGSFVICLMDEEGKEKSCIELEDLDEDTFTTLNAVLFDEEEFAKVPEKEDNVEEEEVSVSPDEEPVEITIGDEPIKEASSAEKRAYRKGGDDLKDLEFGRALSRIKNPHERAMLLHQHRMEKSGKKMSDRNETEKVLDRKLKQAEKDAQNTFKTMQDAGYSEEAKPLDEGVKIMLDDLTLFKPWGGAKDIWDLIIAQDKLEALDKALEDMYPEGITATELNDILWFEKSWVIDSIDLKQFIASDDAIEAEAEFIDLPVDPVEETPVESSKGE